MPGLGQVRQAAESFRKALALQQRLTTEHPDNTEYRRILPILYHHLGRLEPDAQRAITYIEQAFRASEETVQQRAMPARLWLALGLARMQAGDPKSAREAFTHAPAIHARLLDLWARFLEGDIEGALATGRSQLALVEQHLTQYEERTPAYRITMYGVAGQHIGRAIMLAHPVFPNLERHAEALRSAARAVRLAERIQNFDAADGTARELLNLAYRTDAALRWDSEPAIALEELRKAAAFGDVPRADVARALRRLGRRDEAASELEAVLRETPGHGNEEAMLPSTGMSVLFYGSEADAAVFARQEMAQLRLDRGDAAGALPFLNQAVEMTERLLGARPHMTPLRARLAQCYQDLGKWYESAGQPSQALMWHKKSLSVWREWTKWGVSNPFQLRRQREAEGAVQRLERTALSAIARVP